MGKRGFIMLGAIGLALVLALVFLVSEARDGSGDGKGAKARNSRNKTASSRKKAEPRSSGKEALRKQAQDPDSEPGGGRGPVIKTTADGRTYVESIKPDGRRIRDFRKSAVRDLKRRKRLPGGSSPIAPKNAISLKKLARPAVWKCMHQRYDVVKATPGIGKRPTVTVFARTRATATEVEITTAEAELEADEQDSELARCIEGAVEGLKTGHLPGVDQSAYEDFEVGLRYQVPPPRSATSRP
ncbi:MAG: hypothetical protein KJO07_12860 [Deltaproteobacteria bacterium]|nr:hypothetical protein [Deltaproteobacteria bacterium]